MVYCSKDDIYQEKNNTINRIIEALALVGRRSYSNILYEYDDNELLEISYVFFKYGVLKELTRRIDDADIVFYAMGPDIDSGIPDEILDYVPKDKLYIVGNKKFGYSNGIIYANRNNKDYYKQTVKIPEELIRENENYKSAFGDRYVDMIQPVKSSQGKVRVFTDNNMFISQDCSHLTKAGAQYYSRRVNIDSLLKINR